MENNKTITHSRKENIKQVLNHLKETLKEVKENSASIEDLELLVNKALETKEKANQPYTPYTPPRELQRRQHVFQLLESISRSIKSSSIMMVNGRTSRWFTDYKTPAYRETILSLDHYSKYIKLPHIFTLIDETLEKQVGYNLRNLALNYSSKFETIVFGPLNRMVPLVEERPRMEWKVSRAPGLKGLLGKKEYIQKERKEEHLVFKASESLMLRNLISEGPDKEAYYFQYAYYPKTEEQAKNFQGTLFAVITTKETFGDLMSLVQHHPKRFPELIQSLVSNDVPDKGLIAPMHEITPIQGFSLENLFSQFHNHGRTLNNLDPKYANFVLKKF